jgi:gliding motility-associated-like protein
LACVSCSTAVVAVQQPVLLHVTTANAIGCRATDSIWVMTVDCPELVLPSAFSPNNDGKNDNFFLLSRNFSKLDFFEVYNRWGELVYTTTDLNAKGWDGTYKGQVAEIGVYVYKTQVVDRGGQVKSKTGNVTLIK